MKDTNTDFAAQLELINQATSLQFAAEPDGETFRSKELRPEAADAVKAVFDKLLGDTAAHTKPSSYKPLQRIEMSKDALSAAADILIENAEDIQKAAATKNTPLTSATRLPQPVAFR